MSVDYKGADDDAYTRRFTQEECIDYYNKWHSYDNDLDQKEYGGPREVADLVNKYVKDKNSKIIDVGAGTGFIAEHLLKDGFKSIDAIEPSDTMADVAEKKGIYGKIYRELVTAKPTSVSGGTYDVTVLAGALGPGYIDTQGLQELLRLTKPGGLVIFPLREERLVDLPDFEPTLNKMEAEGKWKQLQRYMKAGYSHNFRAVYYVYQVSKKDGVTEVDCSGTGFF